MPQAHKLRVISDPVLPVEPSGNAAETNLVSLISDHNLQLPQGDISPKIARFLATSQAETPFMVVDLDIVHNNYLKLANGLLQARVFYAVKANPAPEIIRLLESLGSCFDTASAGEIDICMELGVPPHRISYGNTIKKERDIAYAYEKGIRLFAFDSEAELDKLARSAPGAQVFCRILTNGSGAEWPLSRKFGCTPDMAHDLLVKARDLGLDPYGISFHVGSQQTDLAQWDIALGDVADLFTRLEGNGINLRLVNLGGGFPSRYRREVPPVAAYASAILGAMDKHFGHRAAGMPDMIIEPGRSLVGDAGVLQTEVVLISKKDKTENKRWVFLDVGKFSGLAETMDEAIRYRLKTDHDGSATGPVILAGPTCDSADTLYEKADYELPLDLEVGDKVQILSTGAYTTTYSSVAFNGFAPLKSFCI